MNTFDNKSIIISKGVNLKRRIVRFIIESLLFLATSISTIAIIFIILFIAKDALPFFNINGVGEFFKSNWYPTGNPEEFGALSIIFGTMMVTFLSITMAVPIALFSAVSLSDILPFSVRQVVKPVIEIIAAIPSVAYGFFALVIFAPILQQHGGNLLGIGLFIAGIPVTLLISYLLNKLVIKFISKKWELNRFNSNIALILFQICFLFLLYKFYLLISGIQVSSGTNAFNVSVILAIMALPTIVSVAEDSLQAVGRELREGSYALGATRAETLIKVVIPAAKSGIFAAIILGVMRAIGETMVVWMASGNAAQIPEPWYNIFAPIRTLTATIAGDMGEADHVTGSSRYHVLFVMALFLLIVSFISNLVSEWIVNRSKKKMGLK